ncbi:MAG TPA: methyltransferase domain-containing protein [Gemmata sp.]
MSATPARLHLPRYDSALSAFHTAFTPELEEAVRRYDLHPGVRVLDCPCGDGFYTGLFARHMTNGALVAADLSHAYLERARLSVPDPAPQVNLEFVSADSYQLPFGDASFDLVWCAQSLISLDAPHRAIRELARVLKPGGRVAVLETDEYHHLLLPWPLDLELVVQKATRVACERKYGSWEKFAQARALRTQFRAAGLAPAGKVTIVADRVAPFGAPVREFLLRRFEHLLTFIAPELSTAEREELDHFTSAESPESFLNRADAELICLATIAHATK